MTHILTAVLGLLRTAGEEPPVSRLVLLWSLGLWHHQHSWIFLESWFPICHFSHISPASPFLRENKSHQKETLVMTRHKNFKCLWKVLSVAKDYKTQLSWLNQEDNFISSHINKGCRRASKLGVSVAPWCQGPRWFSPLASLVTSASGSRHSRQHVPIDNTLGSQWHFQAL